MPFANVAVAAEDCDFRDEYRVAAVAQLVERVLGKDEVTGSNPVSSSALEMDCSRVPCVGVLGFLEYWRRAGMSGSFAWLEANQVQVGRSITPVTSVSSGGHNEQWPKRFLNEQSHT
jgi:hypothetical protein